MKKLLTISSKGEHYTADVIEDEDKSIFFVGDFDVDVDGSPNWRRDPCGQADTTLHHDGKPINSDIVRGIVLPPECIKAVGPMVLGCKAQASYRGRVANAVVFDVGPHFKLGEGSAALARALHINEDPNKGGVDEQEVTFRFWPGVPAVLDGVTYNLQRYGA
jgi:hypothetical protein